MSLSPSALFFGGNPSSAGPAYSIANSIRFDRASSTNFSKTLGAGNTKQWTLSFWFKPAGPLLTNFQTIIAAGSGFWAGGSQFQVYFKTDGTIQVMDYVGGYTINQTTTTKFIDSTAWYHIVLSVDTTIGTNAVKLYVNGVLDTQSNTGVNADTVFNSAVAHYIGGVASYYTDCYLADVFIIDGQTLTPSSFGLTDSNGVWSPKEYTGSLSGTNTTHLDFADASSATTLGYDVSGNGNDFTPQNITVTGSGPTGYQMSFDGNADAVTLNSNITLTGDFTVEAWIQRTAFATNYSVVIYGDTNTQLALDNGANGNVSIYLPGASGSGSLSVTNAIPDFGWHHVAWVRQSGTVRIYVDGVQKGASPTTITTTTANISQCGRYTSGGAGYDFQGYLSGWRVTLNCLYPNGTTFTPSQQPGVVTGTNLCTFVSSTLIDISGTKTLTAQNQATLSVIPLAGATRSPLKDSPVITEITTSDGGDFNGNFCVFDYFNTVGHTLSQGGLSAYGASQGQAIGSFAVNSGKWYWEVTIDVAANYGMAGISLDGIRHTSFPGSTAYSYGYLGVNGNLYHQAVNTAYGATWGVGDIIGVALDMDNGNLYFYKNGVIQNSGTPAATGLSGYWRPSVRGGISGNVATATANFGQRPFAQTPPTGYSFLSSSAVAAGSVVTSGSFTGNGSADGPVVFTNGVPATLTINGNPVTFGTHARKFAYGFQVISTSGSYNAVGTNTFSVTTAGPVFKFARAQSN